MVLPETARGSPPGVEPMALEQPTGASGTRLKVATRPSTVGTTWLDLFHPGTPSRLSLEARVRVVADIAGALIQIHDNSGIPRQHRRHGRVTPRHVLVGVDGSASLFTAKEPFSKLLPPQPDLGYLAPELLTQSGPSNQQSDVFSLGALLWEALDNGRLFPHRRAAAISRLIARRSLPPPRIEEEWALPLSEVAMKALLPDPEERYLDATAFWLALREHLPPPDQARSTLSRLVQRALRLELTTEIRDAPPYLVSSQSLIRGTLPPAHDSLLDSAPPEASARYSMRPEPSSRQPEAASRSPYDNPAWAISDVPPRSSQLDLRGADEIRISHAPAALGPSSQVSTSHPGGSRPSTAPNPSSHVRAPQQAVAQQLLGHQAAAQAMMQAHSEPPISTLHFNLPRDLVDASLPFYVSSQPAPRPFPWGALSFAALIFFGVGAAVAFGAVTALRTVSHPPTAPTPAELRPSPANAAPPPLPQPVVQTVQDAVGASLPTPAATPNAGAVVAGQAIEAQPPKEAARTTETLAGTASEHKPLRRAIKPPKPKRSAPKAPPPESTPPTVLEAEPPADSMTETKEEPQPDSTEDLPFIEQPY